jgi:hypothetical protein
LTCLPASASLGALRVWLLSLLLVLSLLPTMEVVEAAVHLVEHGDLAHGDSDGHGTSALGSDEHGCSGTFHLCGCHSASVITPTPSELQAHHAPSSRTASFVSTGRDGLGATAPPHRPPIA